MTPEENPEADDRLQELEERLTFQQRLIEELNEVALGQQKRLDDLARRVARLAEAVERIADASPGGELPHEKPPHY